jgi:hypothetical protein
MLDEFYTFDQLLTVVVLLMSFFVVPTLLLWVWGNVDTDHDRVEKEVEPVADYHATCQSHATQRDPQNPQTSRRRLTPECYQIS